MESILQKYKENNVYISLFIKELPYKTKQQLLHEYNTNIFIPTKDKEEILRIIQITQRAYNGFTRLAQIYKFKNAKTTISIDLYLNEISKHHRNTLCINMNSTNYWFTISDICNHIFAALTNSPYYFADPIPIKNPYTNIPFTNAQLYTIYFKVRASTFLTPVLFHKFFLCNFDLLQFRLDNESEIRESFIHRYLHTTEENILYTDIQKMILYKQIHPKIPKSEIVKIMRPYLYLYMVSKYHIFGLEKSAISLNVLYVKLNELYEYNPNFGRIYMKQKCKISYDLDHPKFGWNDAIQSLSKSIAL